ncbi:glutaredoxin family protein [Sporichthya polymorpha]|uniref:glutaredoxin family protein n=1 Tax=Sporichthya polymorpha TaxID=35751 RepID=UPI00036090DB|nr:glutaredoxin family protein [Sporichthya polymorpha]
MTQPGPAQPRVTVLTKPGCGLCEKAMVVIEEVCTDLGVGWTEIDITKDEDLFAKWWEQIPVTLVDGVQHTFWRVDPDRLRAALTR